MMLISRFSFFSVTDLIDFSAWVPNRDAPIRIFGTDQRPPKAVSADPDIADHRSQRLIHKLFNIVVLCNFHIFN